MVEVPQEAVQEQRQQLQKLAEAVESIVKDVVNGSDGSNNLYQELMRQLGPLLEAQQLDAASFASQFYDWIREESIGKPLNATPYTGIKKDAFERELGYIVHTENDPDKLIQQIINRADRHMMQAYANSMLEAARKDDAEVRFARMTQNDNHVCEFCDMLSSRGWVYYTAKTATQAQGSIKLYHAHCRCIAIPGFGTYEVGPSRRLAMHTTVEGYDPEAAFVRYLKAGGQDAFKYGGDRSDLNAARRRRRNAQRVEDLLNVQGSDEFLSGAPNIEDLQWRFGYLVSQWRAHKSEEFHEESIEDILIAIATKIYRNLLEKQEASIDYK